MRAHQQGAIRPVNLGNQGDWETGPKSASSLIRAHTLAARALGEKSSLASLTSAARLTQLHPILRLAVERVRSGRKAWVGYFALWIARFLLGRLQGLLHAAVRDLLDADDDLRRAWQILDIGLAALRGILVDGVLLKGLDTIEDQDFSRWLEKNGCRDSWSPVIRSVYDSGAHFERGDASAESTFKRPASANLAAGTAVHCLLRMFAGYSGAYSYRMNAGMGETVFTPLYLALRHLGVRFAFFQRVRSLRLNQQRDAIAEVELDVQAEVSAGPLAYEPLLPAFRGLLTWPAQPFFDQLQDGSAIAATGCNFESSWCHSKVSTNTLRVGPGLDCQQVVLGISIASLPTMAQELADASASWRSMFARIKTVQTQFCQVWLTCPGSALNSSDSGTPTIEGFIEPIDTWLDMSQVSPREGWPEPPGSVHYFVGPLMDTAAPHPPDFPDQQDAVVFKTFSAFFERQVLKIWPLACRPDAPAGFNWNLMRAPEGVTGSERLRHQYIRANVDPAHRYVLSVAGSKRYRMRSDQSGFGNLFLAGDWTLNGINAGCVEAAVMSGMQAAQGISGYPRTILGDWAEMAQSSGQKTPEETLAVNA